MVIGTWPTEVRRLAAASESLGAEIWAKSEETAGAWGGNKVRKLEFILDAARRDRRTNLLSWGAGSSNWTAALALHGRAAGFSVSLGLGGPVPKDYRALYRSTGTRLVSLPRLTLAPVALAAAWARAGGRALFIPVGGSGTVGDIGTAQLGEEIAVQIKSAELPLPSAVFVATGSSGTAAGLAVGLGHARAPLPVVAVKVSDWPYATTKMVTRRISSLLDHLEQRGIRNVVPAPWRLERAYLGPGYGKPTEASRAAIALAARDGLTLDPTYGAKAFAALVGTARRDKDGPYLFVHTSPARPAPS